MANTGSNIRTYLLTKSAITDLVATRIRPDVLAQGDALPAIIYSELYTNHQHTLTGAAGIEECLLELSVTAARERRLIAWRTWYGSNCRGSVAQRERLRLSVAC